MWFVPLIPLIINMSCATRTTQVVQVVKKIHTGIKKDQSFDFNLERARDLVKRYGFELAEEKLESMRLYSWIGHDPSFE